MTQGLRVDQFESPFSANHALKTVNSGNTTCWICMFPIGKNNGSVYLRRSRDHVLPRKLGGRSITEGNIRWAHRYCNSRKGHSNITPELVEECREFVSGLMDGTTRKAQAKGRWLEEFGCGCSNVTQLKGDRLEYCPTHGADAVHVYKLVEPAEVGLTT